MRSKRPKPAIMNSRVPDSMIKFVVSKPACSYKALNDSRCSALKSNKSVWICSKLTISSEFKRSRFVSYMIVNIIS